DPGRVRGLHRGEGVRVDVVHADRPALAVEPLGRRQSDAGRSARDEDRCHVLLPRQSEFHGRGETSRAGTRAGACVDDTPPGAARHHVRRFRRLFRTMSVLAVPTVAFSPMFGDLLGYPVPGWGLWVSAALGTVMYVWGGRPFLSGGADEVRARQPGMMLLISLGITVAFLSSWGATIGLLDHGLEFWWELALLIVIMLLGHWVEMRSLAQTSSALDSLAALLPDEAERVVDDGTETVAPGDLGVGDVVIIRPGGNVPADGVVVQGTASMDESMITGESHTVSRTEGEQVVAGTVATDSGLRVRVNAVGGDTALAG